MLDIKLIRENPDAVKAALARKKADASVVDRALEMDKTRRELIQETDALKNRRNQVSKEIPQLVKAGGDVEPLKAESRAIGDKLKQMDERLAGLETEQKTLLMEAPNLPHASVPDGHGAEDNKIVRVWGQKPEHGFAPKAHWDLGKTLDILDLERGTKLSGSGFYILKGNGARLERSLISWMLDTHTGVNGYTEVAPPFVVSRQTMTGTGQLPKFEEDLYKLQGEELFLVPTAEVPVTNIYADEIVDVLKLPIKMCAYTPCFRREAGSHGKETRGISRVHQFSKVEMVWLSDPKKSYDDHEVLTSHATAMLEALGLRYRVALLCAGDMSAGAAKCYDLEVWAPGMNMWLEVSSCSNFEDYQARRAGIRFKREQGSKPELVHTLNGSGLALPRLLIALMETYQQADGSIALPPVLQKYMGCEKIG